MPLSRRPHLPLLPHLFIGAKSILNQNKPCDPSSFHLCVRDAAAISQRLSHTHIHTHTHIPAPHFDFYVLSHSRLNPLFSALYISFLPPRDFNQAINHPTHLPTGIYYSSHANYYNIHANQSICLA